MAAAGSFDDFFRLEQGGLVRYAALLTGSTAQGEDLVQDVLVRCTCAGTNSTLRTATCWPTPDER